MFRSPLMAAKTGKDEHRKRKMKMNLFFIEVKVLLLNSLTYLLTGLFPE